MQGALNDEVMIFDLLTLQTRRMKARRMADCGERHLHAITPHATDPAALIDLPFDSLAAAAENIAHSWSLQGGLAARPEQSLPVQSRHPDAVSGS